MTENSKKEQFVRVVSSNLTLSFLRNVLKEEREIKESVLLKQQTKQPTKQPAPKVTPTQQVKGIVIKDAIIKDVIIEDEIIKDAIIKDVIIEDEIIKDAIIKEEDLTGELPTEYDETRVVIQARDPHWAWVYWELSSMERKSLEAKHGTFDVNGINLVLRVINESMGYTFDVSLPKNCNDWYLSLNDADCDYRVQLCLNIPSKGIEEITSSNSIHTPTDKVSERIAKWVPAIVEPQPVVAEAEGNVPAGECTISSVNDYAIENEVLEPISVKCDYIGGSSESIFNNGATTPELDSASSDFARPRSK